MQPQICSIGGASMWRPERCESMPIRCTQTSVHECSIRTKPIEQCRSDVSSEVEFDSFSCCFYRWESYSMFTEYNPADFISQAHTGSACGQYSSPDKIFER